LLELGRRRSKGVAGLHSGTADRGRGGQGRTDRKVSTSINNMIAEGLKVRNAWGGKETPGKNGTSKPDSLDLLLREMWKLEGIVLHDQVAFRRREIVRRVVIGKEE